MKEIHGVEELVDRYDLFLFDQYGVLHDGMRAYPGGASVLNGLRRANKDVLVVSNSGRGGEFNRDRIVRLGYDRRVVPAVLTSGDCLADWIASNFRGRHVGVYATGELDGPPAQCEVRADPGKADLIVLNSFRAMPPNESELERLLSTGLELGLPLVCTNPDETAMHGSLTYRAPGSFAREYLRRGGTATFLGKPFPLIFEKAAERFPRIPRDRILVIGDSLEHDIAGASGVRMDSVWILHGIHRPSFLSLAPADRKAKAEALAVEGGVDPTYALSELCWRAKTVVVLGALDSKGPELKYVEERVWEAGCLPRLLDSSLKRSERDGPDEKAALMAAKAAELAGRALHEIGERGNTAFLAIGGGVGSSIALSAMKELPFGVTKVLVSTLPFDPRQHVARSDVIIVPTVVDVQGLNPVLRMALDRGAAIACALENMSTLANSGRPVVGFTGLGITDGAAKACQKLLDAAGFEMMTFHANGFGSRAFERLVRAGAFCGVIDLTTHELNSLLFGGVAVPESSRLTAAAECGMAQVICPGGLDVLTRGPVAGLTPDEASRPHYRHSPEFTHVRATGAQMVQVAALLASRVAQAKGPTVVVIPRGGTSNADRPGSPMWAPEVLEAFVAELRNRLPAAVPILETPHHINSPEFARVVAEQFLTLIGANPTTALP